MTHGLLNMLTQTFVFVLPCVFCLTAPVLWGCQKLRNVALCLNFATAVQKLDHISKHMVVNGQMAPRVCLC